MCEQIDLSEKEVTGGRRKKLWDLPDRHHCAVLGTCLRRSDLRRFAKKKLFRIEAGASDYRIHLGLVGFSTERNPKSRYLHKFLDERYRVAVKRYAAVREDDGALELWEQDLKKGTVAGAYWAIMTNQFFSVDVRNQVYGQIHMMSHDNISVNQGAQRLAEELKNKAAVLEEVLVSERQLHLQEQKAMSCEIETLKKLEEKRIMLAAENKKIIEENSRLKLELAGSGLSEKMEKLKKQLSESNKRNVEFSAEIETLKRALADSRDLFDLANSSSQELTLKNAKLEENIAVIQREVLSMETAMLGAMDASCSCSTCGDQDTNRCPGPDLCGKTILYVGGLHKMVSHYRQLIENHGGKFLHHDGGKEASRTILPKMLSTADAVLCPIDCVSHDACTCVKKICKRYQKPYVMMRSSGLSSLAKGLTEIVQ